MRPEKHAVTHPAAGSLAGQKPGKLSGLTDIPQGANASGFLALLASQCPDSPSITAVVETDDSNTSGQPPLMASVPGLGDVDPLVATSDTASVVGNGAQIELTFLLSQIGSLLPPAADGVLPAMELASNVSESEGPPLDPAKNTPGGLGEGATATATSTASLRSKSVELYRPAADLPFVGISAAIASISSTDLMTGKAGATDKNTEKLLTDKSGMPADAAAPSKAQDPRALKLSAAADNLVSRMFVADPILVRSVVENDLRQIERQLTKTQTAPASLSVEGLFGSQAQFSGEKLGPSPATSDARALQPEVYVAEQVNYWVARDVQNAELRLKGFDDFPIDVHISMQGNDAQVDFRTDHAEIRDMLRTTEAHLKDMLAREGLVLSGVSVGTSRRDEQGQAGQQQPYASRQTAVLVEDSSPLTGLSRPLSRSGGALDVFV